jgi:hypothetical protein
MSDLPKKARLDLLTKLTLERLVKGDVALRHCCRCRVSLAEEAPEDLIPVEEGHICADCNAIPRVKAGLDEFNDFGPTEVSKDSSDDCLLIVPRVIQ